MSRRKQLEELLKSSPDDPFLHYGLAMEHRSVGDLAAALECLQRALQLDPGYLAAYFHRGQLLAQLGCTDEARQILREGIPVAQRSGDTHAAEEMAGLLASLD